MKKLFATGFRSVVMVITIVTFIIPTVFGQEEKPAYIPPACIGKPISKMSRAEMMAQIHTAVKPNPPITREKPAENFQYPCKDHQ